MQKNKKSLRSRRAGKKKKKKSFYEKMDDKTKIISLLNYEFVSFHSLKIIRYYEQIENNYVKTSEYWRDTLNLIQYNPFF